MSPKTNSSMVLDKKQKTSFVQCVVSTATKFKSGTTEIISLLQSAIACAENEVTIVADAQENVAGILNILDDFKNYLSNVKFDFSNSYDLWIKNLNINICLEENLNKSDAIGKGIPTFKINTNQNVTIELEDSSSDLEIVNEIQYLDENEKLSKIDKEDSLFLTSKENYSKNTNLSKSPNKTINHFKNTQPLSLTDLERKSINQNIKSVSENINKEHICENNQDSDLSNVSEDLNKKNVCKNNEDKRSLFGSGSNESSNEKLYQNSSKPDSEQHDLADIKLKLKCIIQLEHLPQQESKRCKKKSLEDKSFERLTDLSALERKSKKRYISSDSSSSNQSSIKENCKIKKNRYKKSRLSSGSETSTRTSSDDNSSENDSVHLSNNSKFIHSINKEILDPNEERLKQQLLDSVDDSSDSFNIEEDDSSCYKRSKPQKQSKRTTENDSDSSFNTDYERPKRSEWLNDEILNFKLSDLDNYGEQSDKRRVSSKDTTDESDSTSKGIQPNSIKKKKTRRKILETTLFLNSETESEDCQIIKEDSQLSEDCEILDDELKASYNNNNIKPDVQLLNTQSTPNSKHSGRRNIRKVLEDQQIGDDTKQAAKDEENRVQRLLEHRQELLTFFNPEENKKRGILILDFDIETKKELVTVDSGLVKYLKPHQEEGVKFMWDVCFETLECTKNTEGSGCILAHCMGLGKTFQVITLVHTLLMHKATEVKTVMVVCPMNTVLNWVDEFDMWLKHVENKTKINIYELTQITKTSSKIAQLNIWQDSGGVLIINYEMFRSLTSREKKLNSKQIRQIRLCLMNPGADLVVCDEGHLLKNEDSLLAEKMQHVRTKRRIILTGTPLQNNLSEYHCMIQFVKPHLLGTKVEFQNRFRNPISNGQFDNSTPYDVKLMKYRAHVLHRMLEGCVQRRDYAVLTPFLPPKQEYVILIRLSELQMDMYKYYTENMTTCNSKYSNLLKNYHEMKQLVAHPLIMKLKALKRHHENLQQVSKNTQISRRNNGEYTVSEECWWTRFIKEEHLQDLSISYKLILLFGILERCEKEGDKLLVFSQCLYTLNIIQTFLEKTKNSQTNGIKENLFNFQGEWKLGLDYFRLDGTVKSDKRNLYCKTFNDVDNKRARLLLISTKAGGIGINLIGANRVVIFDPSWNPSNDVQSIFRIYRFGQKKPCYVYRFLTAGTMEQKIYNRQVTKLSLSLRVLDELQIKRHYRDTDLAELYKFEPLTDVSILNLPKDHVLADVFLKYKNYVYKFFEHDSLLENKEEEELDENERKQAWIEYQQEKHSQKTNDSLNKGKSKTNQKKRMLDKNSEATTSENPTMDDALDSN